MLGRLLKKTRDPGRDLREVLGDYRLPSFPAIIVTILEAVRDDDASLSSIADLVSVDPGLTARLLGTVNSAAFSLKHRVKSVHHAVSLLGRGELESILISLAAREALPCRRAPGFDPDRFWTTSAKRAIVARALSELIDPARTSEAFTAALLQDMALPVLIDCRSGPYGVVLQKWHESNNEDLASVERRAFGWDHAAIGASMCRQWQFPEALTLAIEGHHDPGCEDETLPAVQLVGALREVDEPPGVEWLQEAALQRFSLPRSDTAALVAHGFETADELSRLFV